MFKYFWRKISNNEITLLSYINKDFFIDKSSKSRYYVIDNFEIQYFYDFVKSLNSNMVYSVSPMLSTKGDPDDPYIVLGKSILVTKYSDCRLIQYHLYSKYNKVLKDFGVTHLENYKLTFKYKKIRFDIDQIENKFKDR